MNGWTSINLDLYLNLFESDWNIILLNRRSVSIAFCLLRCIWENYCFRLRKWFENPKLLLIVLDCLTCGLLKDAFPAPTLINQKKTRRKKTHASHKQRETLRGQPFMEERTPIRGELHRGKPLTYGKPHLFSYFAYSKVPVCGIFQMRWFSFGIFTSSNTFDKDDIQLSSLPTRHILCMICYDLTSDRMVMTPKLVFGEIQPAEYPKIPKIRYESHFWLRRHFYESNNWLKCGLMCGSVHFCSYLKKFAK